MAMTRIEVLEAARETLAAAYGDRLAAIILFGSEARGDAKPGSDIDLLLVVDPDKAGLPRDDIAPAGRVPYPLDHEYGGRTFGPIHVETSRFEKQDWALDRNALREGVVLWVRDEGLIARARENARELPAVAPEVEPSWREALQAIESARLVLPTDPNAAINRAYYAAFYAVTAFLALDHRHYSKHYMVEAAVHRDLVHQGIWPAELGTAYSKLFVLRAEADYSIERMESEVAAHAIDLAEQILEEIHGLRPDYLPLE